MRPTGRSACCGRSSPASPRPGGAGEPETDRPRLRSRIPCGERRARRGAWREALTEAGVEVADRGELDLAVAYAAAPEAAGSGRGRCCSKGEADGPRCAGRHHTSSFLPLPCIEAPDLVPRSPATRPSATPCAPGGRPGRKREHAPQRRCRGARAARHASRSPSAPRDAPPSRAQPARRVRGPRPCSTPLPRVQSPPTLRQAVPLARPVSHLFHPVSPEPGHLRPSKLASVPDYQRTIHTQQAGLHLHTSTRSSARPRACTPPLLQQVQRFRRATTPRLRRAALRSTAFDLLHGARTPAGAPRSQTSQAGRRRISAQTAADKGIDDENEAARTRFRRRARMRRPDCSKPSTPFPRCSSTTTSARGTSSFAGPGPLHRSSSSESASPTGLQLWVLLFFTVDTLGQLDQIGQLQEAPTPTPGPANPRADSCSIKP